MSRSPSGLFTPPSSPSAVRQCFPPTAFSFHGCPLSAAGSCTSFVPDSLGVRYRAQDSQRWQNAAQTYQSSRAHSPVPYPRNLSNGNIFSTPLSLVEIGRANRKRHAENGGINTGEGSPLELEAIAAVHELANDVKSIAVSDMLPRTADLIFLNIRTVEDQPYTLELTMKGWRIASIKWDSMNGDYTKVAMHTKYYENARQLLADVSPAHSQNMIHTLIKKLESLAEARSSTEVISISSFPNIIY
ncbi:unnamed protein product [Enterobius vermicularis]|uniref:DUF727 domain-containing protein n=1 Tax=Enterobius vermicularis TaxID=51028 RepID=A0A0N4VLS3_ENTVE|nr:unnamed protein product [Enterobius vermicularis]